MAKRPSLAESMKAVERSPRIPAAPQTAMAADKPRSFHAATRVGLKKITTGLEPAKHKQLKRLAIDRDKSVEHLLREAVDDLLAKHKQL